MGPKRLPIKNQTRKLNGRKRSTGGGGGGMEAAAPKSKGGKGTEQVHEAFVRAFGIPTNMYRYLARRHRQRPLFLQRSLTYMRDGALRTQPERSLEHTVTRLVERASTKAPLVNGIQTPGHFW